MGGRNVSAGCQESEVMFVMPGGAGAGEVLYWNRVPSPPHPKYAKYVF